MTFAQRLLALGERGTRDIAPAGPAPPGGPDDALPGDPLVLPCHQAAADGYGYDPDDPFEETPPAVRAELVDYLARWHRLMLASEHGQANTFDHADPLTAAVDQALARCVALLPGDPTVTGRWLEDLAIAMWRDWCEAGRPGQAALLERTNPTLPTRA